MWLLLLTESDSRKVFRHLSGLVCCLPRGPTSFAQSDLLSEQLRCVSPRMKDKIRTARLPRP